MLERGFDFVASGVFTRTRYGERTAHVDESSSSQRALRPIVDVAARPEADVFERPP